MKNLIGVLVIMMTATGATGQNVWIEKTEIGSDKTVSIAGIGEIEVGADYSITALNRDLPAFKEVVKDVKRILAANNIEFSDHYNEGGTFKVESTENLSDIHWKVVTGEDIYISWLVYDSEEAYALAFLYLTRIGYRFSVEPRLYE